MERESLGEYVLHKADIAKTLSAYLDVRKKGSAFVAICPFHNDTNPSLSINPQKNIFKCFVCGVGGNAITFVMKFAHLSYWEALAKVAQLNGIELPKDISASLARTQRETLTPAQKALDDLEAFYAMALQSEEGRRARDYLAQRQIDAEVIKRFGIGYAPKDPAQAIRSLRERKGYAVETLEQAGIIAQGSSSLKDRYAERIMFPLKDRDGHAVGFSGRKYLPDDPSDSKYINSPETPLFRKSALLYNYGNARESMRRDGYLYVVEGFMDVIALFRAGIDSAVGLMGTALTKEHLALLKESGVQIRLSLDSDDPGQNAMRAIAPHLTRAGIVYKITRRFPPAEGKDADEILDRLGKDALLKRMDDLLDPVSYALSFLDRADPGLLAAIDGVIDNHRLDFFRLTPSEQERIVMSLGELTGLPAEFFKGRFGKKPVPAAAPRPSVPGPALDSKSKRAVYMQLKDLALESMAQTGMGDRLLPDLVNAEAQVLTKLPLSPLACKEYEAANADCSQAFATPMFKVIAGYILAACENGEMGTYGLDAQAINGTLQGRIQDARREKSPLVAGLEGVSDNALAAMLELLSRQGFADFSEDSFRSILGYHLEKLEKQQEAYLSRSSDSNPVKTEELQKLEKRRTKVIVRKKP